MGKHNPRIVKARRDAKDAWPSISHAILSLIPVERPGCQTMSVDQYWRMYYDPVFLASIDNDEAQGTVLHEVCHLLLRHHKRARAIVDMNSEKQLKFWNYAADASINEMILSAGLKLPDGSITPATLKMDAGKTTEHYFRELMRRDEEEQQQQQKEQEQSEQDQSEGDDEPDDDEQEPESQESDDESQDDSQDDSDDSEDISDDSENGENDSQDDSNDSQDGDEPSDESDDQDQGDSPGDGEESEDSDESDSDQSGDGEGDEESEQESDQSSDGDGDQSSDSEGGDEPSNEPGAGGSCADGKPRPWELPAPSETEDGDSDGIDGYDEESLAQSVLDSIISKGDAAGNLTRICEETKRPKLDPRKLIERMITQSLNNIISGGDGKYSYRRPSRRPGLGGIVRPRSFTPVPKIKVLIDTSGSMGSFDFALVLGLVSKALSSLRLRDGIEIMTGDTHAAWCGKVFDHSKIQLCGGGGTDMSQLIRDAVEDKRNLPDLIIVGTDGYTGWCDDVGVPVIACITRSQGMAFVPKWIKAIHLE